jgi:hypothetical protein
VDCRGSNVWKKATNYLSGTRNPSAIPITTNRFCRAKGSSANPYPTSTGLVLFLPTNFDGYSRMGSVLFVFIRAIATPAGRFCFAVQPLRCHSLSQSPSPFGRLGGRGQFLFRVFRG